MLATPLPKHPQYTTVARPTAATPAHGGPPSVITEHRVAPRRTRHKRSTRWRSRAGPCAFLAIVLVWWRFKSVSGPTFLAGVAAVLALALASCWRVLYQSVTPLPGLGVQLSTVRGFTFLGPSSTSRLFVPLHEISTVVVHEGLRRWSVRYYLGVVRRRGNVVVAFDAVNPHPEVLREVYHGVREVLYDEYASEGGTE